MQSANFNLERKLQIAVDTPPRLLDDIETYSALVELQNSMSTGPTSWYSKLN